MSTSVSDASATWCDLTQVYIEGSDPSVTKIEYFVNTFIDQNNVLEYPDFTDTVSQ